MSDYRVNFEGIAWSVPARGVRFKALEHEGRRLRLVEFSREFVEPDWCRKGHIGFVLEGRMQLEFAGSTVMCGPGDGLFIPPGETHKHKAVVLSELVRAILVEDVVVTHPSRLIPTLRTARLVLRPFKMEDASTVQRLAGAREIADTTLSIPHPYADGVAEAWISRHQERFDSGRGLPLAITLGSTGELVGAMGLAISPQHLRAGLGYWIGREYWNRGYCTEAARELVQFGFEQLGLQRITGEHLRRNPASGRVMRKIGMRHEGTLRQHVQKWDRLEDIEFYGILKGEMQSVKREGACPC